MPLYDYYDTRIMDESPKSGVTAWPCALFKPYWKLEKSLSWMVRMVERDRESSFDCFSINGQWVIERFVRFEATCQACKAMSDNYHPWKNDDDSLVIWFP